MNINAATDTVEVMACSEPHPQLELETITSTMATAHISIVIYDHAEAHADENEWSTLLSALFNSFPSDYIAQVLGRVHVRKERQESCRA